MFIIGISAAFVDAIKTAPQLYKSYMTKSTKDLSWSTLFLSSTSGLLWFLYGYSQIDIPIIISASFYFLSNLLLVYVKQSHDEHSVTYTKKMDKASSTDD